MKYMAIRNALSCFAIDESSWLEQMRRRRTFVTNRSIPCSFTPSVRSNQICFALKQSRVELRKKNFLIGITRHRFLKVYLSPRSRTFVSHRFVPCSFLFTPLSFQSNLLCSKAKPCGNTKETTAQISQSLPDSKTSSHCSRLDKCISQGKLSFLARPLRTDIETFQHEKSD